MSARLVALIAAGGVLLAACAESQVNVPPTVGTAGGGITATGTGRVSGTPDLATITVGVEVRADSAQAALEQASQGARDVIDTLRGAGVDGADVATSNLSVSPVYGETRERVVAYEATNTVTATLRDLDGAGSAIDAAAGAAGENVVLRGIAFSFSDASELVAEARAQAVEQARAQAEELAEAAGVTLGPLVSLTESGAGLPGPLPFQADVAESAVPIEPGSQELTVSVTAVYAVG